jgi:hypothetical protein
VWKAICAQVHVVRAVETESDHKSFQEACERIVGAASDAIFRTSVVKKQHGA